MASAQSAHDHQTVLNELVKQAQSDDAARVANSQPQEYVYLLGNLRNLSSGPMNLLAEKVWSGEFVKKYPNFINSGTTAAFEQIAEVENGVKSAVVYKGFNIGARNTCGWLVAWSNPDDMQAKKVYVECGAIENYSNIDWEKIETQLNKSADNSNYSDAFTGTSVSARIVPALRSADGLLVVAFNGY